MFQGLFRDADVLTEKLLSLHAQVIAFKSNEVDLRNCS
jgi:hypothetical protein